MRLFIRFEYEQKTCISCSSYSVRVPKMYSTMPYKMKLSPNDLFTLCQCAIAAAIKSGGIINQYTNSQVKVNLKRGGSSLASQVVTEIDYLSQAAILETLIPTCNQFDLALLTEETPDDQQRLEKNFFWCIDPLDGTLPFIDSTPGYSVAIALVSRQGIPFIGVIYDPVTQTLYHAILGQGAFRNNVAWQTLNPYEKKQRTLTFITDRSFIQHKHYAKVINQLNQLGYDKLNIIQHGGATMNACWVMEQAPACYFKFPKKENGGGSLWDFAATACLFTEMSTVVSDIHGQPLDLNRKGSTFMNHRGIIYATDSVLSKEISNIYLNITRCSRF